jgi:glycolate oxidase iron-sulfur subunit
MVATKEKVESQGKLGSLLEENSDSLLTCVHCGLCLPACPTYRQLGDENDSPRGRIYLMRSMTEGKISLSDSVISHIDLCLGCRGCESVCPSGVPYGHLLEAARVEVARARLERGSALASVVRLVLNHIFTRPLLLRAAMAASRFVRDSGLARLALEANLVSGRLRFALALLAASRSPLARRSKRASARAGAGEASGGAIKVALLTGCVMEGLFSETNRATARVLARNGCRLTEADSQVCCGALHSHAGELETAKRLARKNIEAFSASGCDRVIVNSAGCGAAMKEYGVLLADDPDYAARAKEFSAKVKDISEFLVESGITAPRGKIARHVTYDAPCHLIHAQKIAHAPIEVLRAIPGVKLTPLAGLEHCCGGAGIYNLQHPELSGDILSDKLESIRATGADTVATANPGCIMQIGAGAMLADMKVDVIHPVELLDAAYWDEWPVGESA